MGPNVLSFDMVSLILGIVAGLAMAMVIGIWPMARMIREKAALSAKLGSEQEGRERIQAEFRLLAQDALRTNQEQFLVLAGEKLKAAQSDGAHDLEKRQSAIAEMVKPLQKHLEILGSTVEQIKGTDQMLKDEINSLTRETARLSGVLRDPTAQGQWGEYILEGVMEHSGPD